MNTPSSEVLDWGRRPLCFNNYWLHHKGSLDLARTLGVKQMRWGSQALKCVKSFASSMRILRVGKGSPWVDGQR